MAGVPAIIATHLATALDVVDTISVSILFYGNDRGGPDSEDASSSLSEPFEARVNGHWTTVASMGDPVTVRFPSGLERPVYRMAMADGMTLAQATGARDVAIRLGLDDITTGRITRLLVQTGLWKLLQSPRMAWLKKRLSHNPTATGAPHEIVVEVSGKRHDNTTSTKRATILDPAGQSHLTAIGAAAGIERLLGYGMDAIRPGLAVPETAPDPSRLITLLQAHNVQLKLS
jgi:saccharopine dehydrogenase-like NADP-dependent oxidoreductase